MPGAFMELTGSYGNNILFSASVPKLTEDEFMALWSKVGQIAYREIEKSEHKNMAEYRIRISPIMEPH